jgi:DNA-binding protein HU-beta
MTKEEFIDSVKECNSLPCIRADAIRSINAVFMAIEKALLDGEQVVISGVGTLCVVDRAARKARNPITGEEVNVPAKKTLKIKTCAGMMRKLTVKGGDA